MNALRELPHLTFLPDGYDGNGSKEWPLILFLHGAGERGTDLDKIRKHGIPKVAADIQGFPFIAVSPQCPPGLYWSYMADELNDLLQEIIRMHRVDRQRIYLTGLSMGGYGTWSLAMAYPDTFAALAPVCGGGDPGRVGRIKHLPIWVFHGAKDDIVPFEESESMVKALRRAGNDVRFTVYPDARHDSWTETYNNPRLYEWFLSHRRKD
jgi:predicted peptidase